MKIISRIIGSIFILLGLGGLIYSTSQHRKFSISSGDTGAEPEEKFKFTFKNNPELDRPMDKYEIADKKYTIRQQYLSQMRDSGIILGIGIIILIFGKEKQTA